MASRKSGGRLYLAVVGVLSLMLTFVSVVLAGPASAKAIEGNCMAAVTPTATIDLDSNLDPTGTITITWTDACSNVVATPHGYLGYYNIEVSNDGGDTWTTVTVHLHVYRQLAPPSESGSYTIPADFAYPCGDLLFRVIAVAQPNSKISISLDSNSVASPNTTDCGGPPPTSTCDQGSGALTLGYYSNKNGQATITEDDLQALRDLPLRNATGGDFDPQTAGAVKNWLLKATATNMSYMLSAQLATLELNIWHGLVHENAVICDTESQFDGQTVQDLVDQAVQYLADNPYVVKGGAIRVLGDALETLIDEINNNLVAFETP